MKNNTGFLIFLTLLLGSFDCLSQLLDTTIYIDSKILGERRSIAIGLPADYFESEDTYGCLYTLDAEYKYDICRSIHQFFEISTRIQGTIIIGIANSSKQNRIRDLLPTNFGGSDSLFRAFIEYELMPYLENNYRCNDERIIFGHSHGGVFAVNTLIHKPDLFKKYIAADGSFQIINSNMPDSLRIDFSDKSLYISSSDGLYGHGKEISSDMYTNNVIFQNYIMQNRQTDLKFYSEHIDDDHSHSLITAFHRGFRWIMGWPISKDTLKK